MRTGHWRSRRVVSLILELIIPGTGLYALGFPRRGGLIAIFTVAAFGASIAGALHDCPAGYWTALVVLVAVRLAGIVGCTISPSPAASPPSAFATGTVFTVAAVAGMVAKGWVLDELMETFRVSSNAMFPAFSSGDLIIVNKRNRVVTRGAIVAYRYRGDVRVSRVVALPGETIRFVRDDWFLNGERVSHRPAGMRCVDLPAATLADGTPCDIVEETIGSTKYPLLLTPDPLYDPPRDMVTLRANQVFLLGDNRHQSLDSLAIGPVDLDDIVGRVQAIWFHGASAPNGRR